MSSSPSCNIHLTCPVDIVHLYLVINVNITILPSYLINPPTNLVQATGRLTWLPLCEYKGDGRVVSLTQLGKEMQVAMMLSLSNQRIC